MNNGDPYMERVADELGEENERLQSDLATAKAERDEARSEANKLRNGFNKLNRRLDTELEPALASLQTAREWIEAIAAFIGQDGDGPEYLDIEALHQLRGLVRYALAPPAPKEEG